MLLIWLLVWVLNDTPTVAFSPINGWALALIICGIIHLLPNRGGRE